MNAIHARSQLRYWPTFGEENPNSSMRPPAKFYGLAYE